MESTKSVSDLYAPVTAKVIAVNAAIWRATPAGELRPVRAGWLLELQADGDTLGQGLAALLDAAGYGDNNDVNGGC